VSDVSFIWIFLIACSAAAVGIAAVMIVSRKSIKAGEALRLRNRAIESSVNAVMIASFTGPDKPIEYVNPAFERMTGYVAAEALGRNANFLFGTDTDQPGFADVQAALAEQREAHATLRCYRKDGSPTARMAVISGTTCILPR